ERVVFDKRALAQKAERRQIELVERVVEIHTQIEVRYFAPKPSPLRYAQVRAEITRASERVPPDSWRPGAGDIKVATSSARKIAAWTDKRLFGIVRQRS